MILRGVAPALVTPIDDRGEVDEDGLERVVTRVLAAGVHGISPTGSTGEGARLTRADRLRVTRRVRAMVPADLPVISGVSFGSVSDGVAELAELAAAGASAALVPPPAYYPMSDEQVEGMYRWLAERAPLPLVLYNIPVYTKIRLAPQVVGRLATLPGIAGIKDSSRDMEYLQQVLAAVGAATEFAVLTGTDTQLLPSLVLGVAGTICGSANLVPELGVGIATAVAAGDLDVAREQQLRLADIVLACRVGQPPAGWKAALDLAGVCGPNPVAPATPLAAGERETLARRLGELGVVR